MTSRSISSVKPAPIHAATETLVAYATKDGTTAEDGAGSGNGCLT